jgi:hypothetical protein
VDWVLPEGQNRRHFAAMADEDEKVPTATIAEPAGQYLFPDENQFKMIFTNPDNKKFAFVGDVKRLPDINKMCGLLMSQYHKSKPEAGTFFRRSGEATVSASDSLRGVVMIQFDGDIAHVIPIETALKLAELIHEIVAKAETPEEKRQRVAKKHPTVIVPKQRIITQ